MNYACFPKSSHIIMNCKIHMHVYIHLPNLHFVQSISLIMRNNCNYLANPMYVVHSSIENFIFSTPYPKMAYFTNQNGGETVNIPPGKM